MPATPDDSYVWFVETGSNQVGKISPFGVITQTSLPAGAQPNFIASISSNGDTLCCITHYYLVTEPGINQLASIAGPTYGVPTANAGLRGIAAAGYTAVFTEYNLNQIGELSSYTSGTAEYTLPTPNSGPTAIAAGYSGNFWIVESNTNRIALFNSGAFTISEYDIPTANAGVSAITSSGSPGPDAYFAEQTANKIGAVTSTGVITEFPIPTANTGINALVVGPSGNVWFTEPNVNRIGMMTPTGTFKEYQVPTANAGLAGISLGDRGTTTVYGSCCVDNRIWFTERNANKIGVLSP
ncbi:MAG TPA: hypothetical protein VKT72_05670 [Candidatus Baltobacteraceae bacterium]|nr:hypothetical protein [Candidatus Baltobacteraceae bacterium]